MSKVRTFRHHRLVGTIVDISISGTRRPEKIHSFIHGEMSRLEKIISVYDLDSEINRWKRGELHSHSDDFVALMSEARQWHVQSTGRFNTAADDLTTFWREHEQMGTIPSKTQAQERANFLQEPRYIIENRRVIAIDDVSHVGLNAFAKGWIVDQALEQAIQKFRVSRITINAGGDLRHYGPLPLSVGIENPLLPFDNVPPLGTITVTNSALATSGSARKGFRIRDTWFSHVLNPMTGWPTDGHPSISISAQTAAKADALATICSCESVSSAISMAHQWNAGAVIVQRDGTCVISPQLQFSPFS